MTQEAKILTAIGVITLLLVVGAAFLFGGSSSPNKPAQKLTEEQTKLLVRENSNVKGEKTAQVMLIEFGDFECPACAAAHPTVDSLLKEYKGKLTFVFRHFPLSMHKHARIAAQAAEAAGAQGKFFEMYDALYQNQSEWATSKNPMDQFLSYAKNIGLDAKKFQYDIESKAFESKIQQDVADGNALGVNATPTFFLNGEKLPGILPYNEFKQKIEAALK